MLRHMAHARLVGQYDANNTYQYIINREDVQLSWLSKAIAELRRRRSRAPAAQPRRDTGAARPRRSALFEEDARDGAGVRRALAAARRGDDQCAASRKMLASSSARRASSSASSSRRWPAGPILLGRRGGRRRPGAGRRAAADRVDRVVAAVALGSNLGDRRAHLDFAVSRLRISSDQPPGFALSRNRSGRRPRTAAAVPECRRGRRRRPHRRREICSTRCSRSSANAAASVRFPAPRARSISISCCLGMLVMQRAGPGRAASAVPRAPVRARAAGGDCAGAGGSGRPDAERAR